MDGLSGKNPKQNKKKPFYIHNNKKIIYFAGIYNSKGCAIITKEANPNLANIHHRQPLILGKIARKSWIEDFTIDNLELTETLESYRVGSYVNSPKNNDSKCIEPI
ncbi:MAG: SOS response-associated peptidase family protein [Paracoccaceae bacterium]